MSRQQVHNASVAQDVGRANLLTNGDVETWQRGGGPFTANNAFYADRWQLSLGSGSSCSVSRQVSGAGPGSGVTWAVQANYTHSNNTVLFQDLKIASANELGYGALLGATVSASMRVYATVAGAISLVVSTDVSQNSLISVVHPGTGWVTLQCSGLVVSPNATLLRIQLVMTATGLYYFDNAILVAGSVPVDFVPVHPADTLARCLRYYEVHGGKATNQPQWFGYALAAAQVSHTVSFHVAKSVTPTGTKNGTWQVGNCNQPALQTDIDTYVMYTNITAANMYSIYATAAGQNFTFEGNP